MKLQKELTEKFLQKAETKGMEVNPIRVLRTNTYSVGNANVLVRTASDLGKRYFFGLNYINAEEIYNLDNSFVAFLCGDIEKTILIPTYVLISHLPEISHDRNGEYKINFTRDLSKPKLLKTPSKAKKENTALKSPKSSTLRLLARTSLTR